MLQDRKRILAKDLIADDDGFVKSLSREDVEYLYSAKLKARNFFQIKMTLKTAVFSLLHLPFFYVNLVLKSIAMRSTILTFALLLNAAWLFSQEDVFSNKTNIALEKVIRDYPNRFHNIRGEMISQHAQMVRI